MTESQHNKYIDKNKVGYKKENNTYNIVLKNINVMVHCKKTETELFTIKIRFYETIRIICHWNSNDKFGDKPNRIAGTR